MIERVRRSLVFCVRALAVLAPGCGGSDTPDNTASANQIQTFADQQLAQRLDANQSAEPLVCEEDGDAQHWKCTTDISDDGTGDSVSLTVNVSCDATGSCVYEPET